MWLCTNFGFFSATRRTDFIDSHDNRVMQIRARCKEHLEQLRDRYLLDELGPIFSLAKRDYKWRAYCTQEAWARAVYAAAMDIDYKNFKNSVPDPALHEAYENVWSALYELQIPSRLGQRTSFTDKMSDEEWDRYLNYWDDKYNGDDEGTRALALLKDSKSVAVVRTNDMPSTTSNVLDAEIDDDEDEIQPMSASEVADVLDDVSPGSISTNAYDIFLTLSQAAKHVGVSRSKLSKFMRTQNQFSALKEPNGQWNIPKDMIEDLEFQYWSITAAQEIEEGIDDLSNIG